MTKTVHNKKFLGQNIDHEYKFDQHVTEPCQSTIAESQFPDPPTRNKMLKNYFSVSQLSHCALISLDKVKELEIQTLIKDHFVFSAVTCISCLFVCFYNRNRKGRVSLYLWVGF